MGGPVRILRALRCSALASSWSGWGPHNGAGGPLGPFLLSSSLPGRRVSVVVLARKIWRLLWCRRRPGTGYTEPGARRAALYGVVHIPRTLKFDIGCLSTRPARRTPSIFRRPGSRSFWLGVSFWADRRFCPSGGPSLCATETVSEMRYPDKRTDLPSRCFLRTVGGVVSPRETLQQTEPRMPALPLRCGVLMNARCARYLRSRCFLHRSPGHGGWGSVS